MGLPADAVSQGPSTAAYPSLVAHALGLTMTVRPTNCHLTGDQLAISGAVADPADNTSRDGQCPVPPQQARNLGDELAAADLAAHPARLVLLQDGADDIDFAACLEYELGRVLGSGIGLGSNLRGQRGGDAAGGGRAGARPRQPGPGHRGRGAARRDGRRARLLPADPRPPARSPTTPGSPVSRTNLVCTGLKANAAATSAGGPGRPGAR